MSNQKNFPDKYNHIESERKWSKIWEEYSIYKWNPDESRERSYVVDTPPPTVSGSLHIGHVFSYTHTDAIVRYQRMQGKNVFYPMGWDDNGLPTERRVQNYFNIKCDPSKPYEKDYKATKNNKELQTISRKNFIDACDLVTKEDEKVFENLWKKLGLSVDWSQTYATINKTSQRVSQFSFLDLVEKGKIYNSESVTMWDIDFRTAVAQAEVEDKEVHGAYHDLRFGIEGEEDEFIISTTRPELLGACIAVAAHPDDDRYKKYFGRRALTPLFKMPIPVVSSKHADPQKGSGILMICTFGDVADVDWWKKSNLPIKQIIGEDGKLLKVEFGKPPFETLDKDRAQRYYNEIAGLRIKQARNRIVELLRQDHTSPSGKNSALAGDPKPVVHPVRFFEKGDNPLEYITTRQWFIKILDYKDELIKQGEKIKWHPEFMKTRYINWVEGLNQDWCVSRQRFFGVPFPVWYPVLNNGETDYKNPIFAKKENIPVDPMVDTPKGYRESQRGVPGGFVPDPDIMDTWNTSSLTPQIASHWGIDEKRHQKLFPSDLRPQAHDIIRTWAFYTIVKAWMHENEIPWKTVAVSGFILDPERKKMSKSKGNAITPENILDQNSSDAVRYWALKGRLGVDIAFDETQFKIGKKLITKIFNASKFVLIQIENVHKDNNYFNVKNISQEFDLSWCEVMRNMIQKATVNFENLDHTSALGLIEETFWNFCDNYLEMVKVVAYRGGDSKRRNSALATLNWTLNAFLRLFAPYLPYVSEEVWSWRYTGISKSIHRSNWVKIEEISCVPKPKFENSFDMAREVLSKVNAFKTEKKVSLKTEVKSLQICGNVQTIHGLESVQEYFVDASSALNVNFKENRTLAGNDIEVSLEIVETN